MRLKSFNLLSWTIEGFSFEIRTRVYSNGFFENKGKVDYRTKSTLVTKLKDRIRKRDYRFIRKEIPSFIGNYEIHHDWYNGGTMYLLTKGEHILRHRNMR